MASPNGRLLTSKTPNKHTLHIFRPRFYEIHKFYVFMIGPPGARNESNEKLCLATLWPADQRKTYSKVLVMQRVMSRQGLALSLCALVLCKSQWKCLTRKHKTFDGTRTDLCLFVCRGIPEADTAGGEALEEKPPPHLKIDGPGCLLKHLQLHQSIVSILKIDRVSSLQSR